jgi:hypothetical protein
VKQQYFFSDCSRIQYLSVTDTEFLLEVEKKANIQKMCNGWRYAVLECTAIHGGTRVPPTGTAVHEGTRVPPAGTAVPGGQSLSGVSQGCTSIPPCVNIACGQPWGKVQLKSRWC